MRRPAILLSLLAATFVLASSAAAVPGGVEDPEDTDYATDIRAVYHDDDAESVTYYIQMWNDFGDEGWVGDVLWDFDEDGEIDGSVQFALEYGPSALVYNSREQRQVDEAVVGRASAGRDHDAPDSTPSNTIRVVVTKAAMERAGMGPDDDGYHYFVDIGQRDDDSNRDATTDGQPLTRHSFSSGGAPATVGPGVAAPTTESSGSPMVLIIGLALLALVLAGGVTLAVVRRRS